LNLLDSAAPLIGEQLGRYRLLFELGQGGMARVFVAMASGLGGFNKLVVLKVLRDECLVSSGPEMFLGEARIAARLNHPNVVQTIEVGEDRGRYFICMEYLEGQPLGRLLKATQETPLPLSARLELICQVLEGLSYMHGFTDLDGRPLSLIHRDISPNNVFVTYDGNVKVLDLGVAKAEGVSETTGVGTFKGKFAYAPPEQFAGTCEQRSDLFSVGIVLWELLTYQRIAQDRSQRDIIRSRVEGRDAEFMRATSGVPSELLEICAKAAGKEPSDRYGSAIEMRDALRAYIKANHLESSPAEVRAFLDGVFSDERTQIRKVLDQRMKLSSPPPDEPKDAAAPSARPLSSRPPPLPSTVPPTPQPGGRLRWLVLAGVAIFSLVALTLALRRPALAPMAQAVDAAPAQLASGGPAPTAAVELVQVRVTVNPSDAQILLDGAQLDGNPFVGRLAKDQLSHRLEARADGKVSEVRLIKLDQDLDLLIALASTSVRSPAARSVARSAPRATRGTAAKAPGPEPRPPSASTGSSLTHRAKVSAVRPIDEADPYAN
jgi:eukaryotic-like serine/threonine-protein kinase